MKQLLMTLALGTVALTASAQSYEYLTFQQTNGNEFSMNIDHLKITFADGNMIATDGTKTQSVALTDMNKMFFSLTPTAINTPTLAANKQVAASIVNGQLHVTAPAGSQVRVFTLDGRQVGTNHLTHGSYLVRINNLTLKVLAK